MNRFAIAAFVIACAEGRALADACSEAFSSASELTQKGQFVDARASLIRCSSDACPAAMRPLCTDDLGKIDARIPTVVFSVTELDTEVFDVHVSVDGKPLTDKLDGKAIEIDPGMHAFRFERNGVEGEQSLVVREGEKNRVLHFVLAPPKRLPPAAPKTTSSRPLPWSVFLGAGLTTVAAGLWIGFGASGLAQKGQLDACRGHCDSRDVSNATLAFNVADVAAVVTLVGGAVTAILFATRPVVIVPAPTEHGAAMFARVRF